MSRSPLPRRAFGGMALVALAIGLAGCTAEQPPPVPATSCPSPIGAPLAAQQRAVEGRSTTAGAAVADTDGWLQSNAELFGGMAEYPALQQAAADAAAAQTAFTASVSAGPALPVLGALSCGRVAVYPDSTALDGALVALATARGAAESTAATVTQGWATERQAQLALAATFTSRPAPVGFDVVATTPEGLDATLKAHHAASIAGSNYVNMRWSMGGKTFPGVGGLVRFTGALSGLYRVTTLLGQMSLYDKSTQGPYVQAINGLAFGAYDAAFQTSWNGSETTLRVWILMRVAD